MTNLGVPIFCLTYLLISSRRLQMSRLDRPAAALLGAVACVGLGVLRPGEALSAVDGATILLLFGVMGMGAFLALDGFFDQVEIGLVAYARTPQRLLGMIVWGAGLLSAFLTNDAVCLLGTPVLVRIIRRQRLPALPFLLAIATAANTGSVATLVGNPQNMLCGLLGGLAYRDYLLLMVPVAILGLGINHGLLWLLFRGRLRQASLSPPDSVGRLSTRAKVTLGVVALSVLLYTVGTHLAWTAAGGFVALMLLHRRDAREIWPRIDWALLLFFAGLFIVVAGLMKSGVPAALFERFPLDAHGGGALSWMRLSAIFLLGSNLVSNVPFILVVRDQMGTLQDPRLAWELLALASTFAGNLTFLGSVANVIVAESGRDVGGIPFWQHLRAGVPLTVLTTLVGMAWVIWMRT